MCNWISGIDDIRQRQIGVYCAGSGYAQSRYYPEGNGPRKTTEVPVTWRGKPNKTPATRVAAESEVTDDRTTGVSVSIWASSRILFINTFTIVW